MPNSAKQSKHSGVVCDQENGDIEQLSRSSPQPSSIPPDPPSRLWFWTTIILLAILVGRESSRLHSESSDTYATGFDTDLSAVGSSIKLKQIRFSGAIKAHENGTLYLDFFPNQPRYVGFPSSEIEQAWETLLRGRYIRLTSDEVSLLDQDSALPTLEKLSPEFNVSKEGVYGAPDMLHSLHCLNILRRLLDIEYYKDRIGLPPEYQRIHMDHCVDQLRQAIMCHSDLTPVTLEPVWITSSKRSLIYLGQTERLHTCRNGDMIRDWVTRRGEETGVLT